MKALMTLAALIICILPSASAAEEPGRDPPVYKSLKCPAPPLGSTWAILNRDGANRRVDKYLSSLGSGESGTGMISSPPFVVEVDKITFTICGHDSQTGGRGENYIALVDARKGQVLLKTAPPQNDSMQERSWDVKGQRGNQVRIEVHDGSGGGGFAWLGIGRIEAGAELNIDFREGMPKGWAESEREAGAARYELITGGVPFKRVANVFTLIPRSKAVEIPCGFAAKRVFFLGCTAAGAKPLETYGEIEIHYKSGSPDVVPLMCGFTLDAGYKLLSPSKALRLHASADPYQHYLAIKPRAEVIDNIRLVAQADGPVPRITAITCETDANSPRFMPLPETPLTPREAAWIESHSISANELEFDRVKNKIRKTHKLSESP